MAGGQPKPESNSQSQGQQRGGKKEQTPDDPSQQPGEKPGEKPEQQQQVADGEKPQGNKDHSEPSEKKPGEVSEDPTQDPLMVSADREQWGNLPIHMQEMFRAEGGDEVPARYRDWIDSYYRRLGDQ